MQRRTSRRKPGPTIAPDQQWLVINRYRFEHSYRARRDALFEYRLRFGGPYPGLSTSESRDVLNNFLDTVSEPADIADYEGMAEAVPLPVAQ